MILPEFGPAGQKLLMASRVLVVGAGGLGSPAATYLAAAGVGRIGLVDHDHVELSNLHRQPLFDTSDLGKPKLEAAAKRLRALNPLVELDTHSCWLDADNAPVIIRDYDLVIDGTDNFPTRYLINDTCVTLGTPWVYGSVGRYDGQVSVFSVDDGPCYRCLHPVPPDTSLIPNCADGGVLGVLPGLIGSLQALEAIKLLTGIGTPLLGRLLLVDGLAMSFHEMMFEKSAACLVCNERKTSHSPHAENVRRRMPNANANANASANASASKDLNAIDIATLLEWMAQANADGASLDIIDVRERSETASGTIPGARLLPLGQLADTLRNENPSAERRMVLVCQSGIRSMIGVRQLNAIGISNVHSLDGGMLAWHKSQHLQSEAGS